MALGAVDKYRHHIDKLIHRLDGPFFFYDLDHLRERLTYMDKVKDSDMKLWYACKANPMSAILKIFRNLHFGVDVASQGELDQALRAGLNAKEILSTGPSKSKKYLRSLMENEVSVIVLESLNQAEWLNEIAKENHKNVKVLLRVQLSWDEKEKSVLGGGDVTAFGVDIETWAKCSLEKYTNLDVIGVHVFQWGNLLDLKKIETIWDKTIRAAKKLCQELNIELQVLDLGGGLGIPYTKGGLDLDFKDVSAILQKLKKTHSLKNIWMELGRYAVGTCGLYFSQIIDKKTVRGVQQLILDGGINHIARPALTQESFPCRLYRNSSAEEEVFNVHGPLCTALDKLGTFSLPKDCAVGDWLVFGQAGAYGFTEAMPFFLCHNLPAEVIVYNGDLMIPRTVKTSADWLI